MNRYRVMHVCRGTPGKDRRRGWYVRDTETGERVCAIEDDEWKDGKFVHPGAKSRMRRLARKLNHKERS